MCGGDGAQDWHLEASAVSESTSMDSFIQVSPRSMQMTLGLRKRKALSTFTIMQRQVAHQSGEKHGKKYTVQCMHTWM